MPTWSRRVGEWGAFVFAAFALVGTSPASVGLAVLTLAYLWNFRDWRVLIQDPLIQACLAFAGIAYSFRLRALIADTRAGEASIFENADSPA